MDNLEGDDTKKRKQQIEVELRVAERDSGLKRQVFQEFHRAARLLQTTSLSDCEEALALYLRVLQTHPDPKFIQEQIVECHVQLRSAEVEADSVRAGADAVRLVTQSSAALDLAVFACQPPAAFAAGEFILARYMLREMHIMRHQWAPKQAIQGFGWHDICIFPG